MATKEISQPDQTEAERPRSRSFGRFRQPSSGDITKLIVQVVLLAFALIVLPSILNLYYVDAMLQVTAYAVVALGLAVLVGRVGMISLGQAAVLAIGAWIGARMLFATSLPFPVVLLASGLITMVIGTLISLPALRLHGMYLALITLMLAGAITTVLATTNFPNGGHGFLGYNGSSVHQPPIRRPSIALSDPAFLRYSIVIAILMFLLVLWHVRARPGRAWAAIRQSEASALASGINIVRYKLWAFALASFITGVAGGLLAGSDKYLYSINFQTQDGITLLAVLMMGGAYNIWGAVLAALFMQLIPQIFNDIGVSTFWSTILLGVGIVLALTSAPRGAVEQTPQDMKRLARAVARLLKRPQPAEGGAE
jgi:branched-chain amino acid transport system permease protein